MNSVVEDISNMLLAESSLDLTFGTNLFLYREPAKPNNCVSIFEGPGQPPIGLLTSNEDTKHYEKPSVQIRIRNESAQDGFTLAYAIFTILQAKAQETWGSYLYSCISAMQNPTMLDWDANNRARIVVNFNIQRRLT